MENTKRVILRSTDNPNFAYLIGKEGDLSVGQDGKFYFSFQDASGKVQTLASGIVGCMGSLELPASKEVCFQTRNSSYVFEKKEREMGLFSYEQNAAPTKEKIPYSEYDALRQTIAGFQRGDYQHLTQLEVSAVIARWNAVNEAVQSGRAELVAGGMKGNERPPDRPISFEDRLQSAISRAQDASGSRVVSQMKAKEYGFEI